MNPLIDQISNVYLYNYFILLLGLICTEFSFRFHKLDKIVMEIKDEAIDNLSKLKNKQNNGLGINKLNLRKKKKKTSPSQSSDKFSF